MSLCLYRYRWAPSTWQRGAIIRPEPLGSVSMSDPALIYITQMRCLVLSQFALVLWCRPSGPLHPTLTPKPAHFADAQGALLGHPVGRRRRGDNALLSDLDG